jgi:large subunit ribosomal protein LP0
MAIKRTKAEKKIAYDKKLCSLLDEYSKVLIAAADNVGSKQLQEIRKGLRGDSIVLMGKNTLIRRCIKVHAEKTGNKDYLELGNLLIVSAAASGFRSICVYVFAFFRRCGFCAEMDVSPVAG